MERHQHHIASYIVYKRSLCYGITLLLLYCKPVKVMAVLLMQMLSNIEQEFIGRQLGEELPEASKTMVNRDLGLHREVGSCALTACQTTIFLDFATLVQLLDLTAYRVAQPLQCSLCLVFASLSTSHNSI